MSKLHPIWPAEVSTGLIATDRLIAGDSEEEEEEDEQEEDEEEEEDDERGDEEDGYSE